jgi:hypothetical protein
VAIDKQQRQAEVLRQVAISPSPELRLPPIAAVVQIATVANSVAALVDIAWANVVAWASVAVVALANAAVA